MTRTLKTLLARLAAALAVLVILFGAAMLLVRTALPYADGLSWASACGACRRAWP
jgi:hypothetical protein